MKRNAMLLGAVVLSMFAGVASASVVSKDLGTAVPPVSVGPYFMNKFDQTAQPANGTSVASIPGFAGGTSVGTSPNATKQTIGAGWATWSNGYTGAVFVYTGTTATLTLPAGSHAFYLYAEPQQFQNFNITVTPSVGAPISVTVNGQGGANGYAFYTTANETLNTVKVTTADPTGFAVGEFAINNGPAVFLDIPTLDPAMLIALAVLLLGAGAWIYRRNRA